MRSGSLGQTWSSLALSQPSRLMLGYPLYAHRTSAKPVANRATRWYSAALSEHGRDFLNGPAVC